MNAVNFDEVNCIYKAPKCGDLPVCVQENEEFETKECVSCWELSDEEIAIIQQQISEGKHPAVYLAVIGGQPPVGMWIRD